MFKNVAAKFVVFAFDITTNAPKTGDAANITAYVSKDYGAVTVLGDTSATEMDATNAPGYYLFDAAQAETNADCLMVSGKSSTANIKVLGAPAVIYTRPTTGWLAPATAGRTLVVDAAGLADANMVKAGPSGSGTAQTTGDIFARLGAPAGASMSADIAQIYGKVDTEVASIITTLGTPAGASVSADIATVAAYVDTEIADIRSRLPAALTGAGNMKVDVLAVNGQTGAASKMERLARSIVTGTVTGSPSTTSIPATSLAPASAANDQFKGLILRFDDTTTTAALRGQATDITAYTHASTTFTVTALTTAPASGDTFTVS